MKVLLVNPPRSPHNALRDHAPPEALRFVHSRLVGPPLGLLTIAVAARDDADVSFIDLKGEYDLHPDAPSPADFIRSRIQADPPDLVGVTFIASETPAGLDILRAVKAVSPGIVTVAGGLHATLCPEDFVDPAVDIVVPGDGAVVFRNLVRTLAAGGDLDTVGGLLVRDGDRLRPTLAPAPPVDPAGRDFLVPDRSYLQPWLSTYTVGGRPQPVTYVFTSLGCTSRCSFCSIWPQRDGAYLQRDVDSVVAELASLTEYEVIRWADANSVVDLEWTARLLDRLEAEGIRKHFVMDLRLDTAAKHPGLIARLARGGLKVVITGIESPRAEELKRYNKALDTRSITEGLKVFADNGILLRANYVVDPDYGPDDFAALADFATAHSTAYAGYTILTPMPGTGLHRQMRPRIVDSDLAKYNFFNCVVETRLPLDRFYEEAGRLWAIRTGDHVIS
jgi:radical SAM superfamily enzyme YgiQ (UPF0313 family)